MSYRTYSLGEFKRKHTKPNNAGFFCLPAPSRSHLEEQLPILQPVPPVLQRLGLLIHHARLIVHLALLLIAQHGVHLAQDLRGDTAVAGRSLGERPPTIRHHGGTGEGSQGRDWKAPPSSLCLPSLPPSPLTWKRRVASSFCSAGTRSGCRRSEARW